MNILNVKFEDTGKTPKSRTVHADCVWTIYSIYPNDFVFLTMK